MIFNFPSDSPVLLNPRQVKTFHKCFSTSIIALQLLQKLATPKQLNTALLTHKSVADAVNFLSQLEDILLSEKDTLLQ